MNPMLHLLSMTRTYIVYFHYLDKNPGWVTDGYGNDDFHEDYKTCGQPVDVPIVEPINL